MGLITTDMQRVVEEQRLGFVAAVCLSFMTHDYSGSNKGTLLRSARR